LADQALHDDVRHVQHDSEQHQNGGRGGEEPGVTPVLWAGPKMRDDEQPSQSDPGHRPHRELTDVLGSQSGHGRMEKVVARSSPRRSWIRKKSSATSAANISAQTA
jgi:hypothetical protein